MLTKMHKGVPTRWPNGQNLGTQHWENKGSFRYFSCFDAIFLYFLQLQKNVSPYRDSSVQSEAYKNKIIKFFFLQLGFESRVEVIKCSLKTMAVDTRVKYPLYIFQQVCLHFFSCVYIFYMFTFFFMCHELVRGTISRISHELVFCTIIRIRHELVCGTISRIRHELVCGTISPISHELV